jgi:two-component system sensor histidine kinase YesM
MLAGLIIVPLTGAILISYYAYGNIQEKEQRAASEKLTADIFYDLKRIFKEAETELIYFGMNSDVELYLYDEAVNQYNYKIGTIQKLIKMPVIAKDYVDSVFIYSIKSSRVIMMEGVAKYESFSEKEEKQPS